MTHRKRVTRPAAAKPPPPPPPRPPTEARAIARGVFEDLAVSDDGCVQLRSVTSRGFHQSWTVVRPPLVKTEEIARLWVELELVDPVTGTPDDGGDTPTDISPANPSRESLARAAMARRDATKGHPRGISRPRQSTRLVPWIESGK